MSGAGGLFRAGGMFGAAGLKVGTGVNVVCGACGTRAPGAGVRGGFFFFLLRGLLRES